jgi:hypothetical protein
MVCDFARDDLRSTYRRAGAVPKQPRNPRPRATLTNGLALYLRDAPPMQELTVLRHRPASFQATI